jgi:hypothetical protein
MSDEPYEKPCALKSIYLKLLHEIVDGDKTYTPEQLKEYIIKQEKGEG